MSNFIKSVIFSFIVWTFPTIVAVVFNIYMSLNNGSELYNAIWTSIPWMIFFTIIVIFTIIIRYISYTKPAVMFVLPAIVLVLIIIPFLFLKEDNGSVFLAFIYLFTMLPGLVTGFIISTVSSIVIFVKTRKFVKNT